MSNDCLTVTWQAAAGLSASSEGEVWTLLKVRDLIAAGEIWKYFFAYRRVRLRLARLESLPRPFAVTAVLRLMSRGQCVIEDLHGQTLHVGWVEVGRRFLKCSRDWGSGQVLRRRIRRQVAHLRAAPRGGLRPGSLDLGGRPVYLRTDPVHGLVAGGSVGHTAGLVNNLSAFTCPPLLFASDPIPTVDAGIECHFFPAAPRYRDFPELMYLAANEALLPWLEPYLPERPSFVYQRYSIYDFNGASLARQLSVPLVLEYNGSEVWIAQHWNQGLRYPRLADEIELLNVHRADLVVVVSQPCKDELVARGADADRILVNPNGVAPDRYSPNVDGAAVRQGRGLEAKTVIGFIGTFDSWHGADVLAEAFGRLCAQHPQYRDSVRLLLIGDGPKTPLVKETLARHGVADCAVLTGLVPQAEGPMHLAACDLLASPHVPNADGSRFFGSPTKLFEYMAMGKGIVASKLDQIGEVLRHDETAWMVRPGDPDDLATGLKVLIDDPDRRRRLGASARTVVLAHYTWKEHTRRIVERLKELCS